MLFTSLVVLPGKTGATSVFCWSLREACVCQSKSKLNRLLWAGQPHHQWMKPAQVTSQRPVRAVVPHKLHWMMNLFVFIFCPSIASFKRQLKVNYRKMHFKKSANNLIVIYDFPSTVPNLKLCVSFLMTLINHLLITFILTLNVSTSVM